MSHDRKGNIYLTMNIHNKKCQKYKKKIHLIIRYTIQTLETSSNAPILQFDEQGSAE
jgi:hypothetical protein